MGSEIYPEVHENSRVFFNSSSLVLLEPLAHVMKSYPSRALDRRLQEDWAKDAREGPRVLMSLRVDFGPMG